MTVRKKFPHEYDKLGKQTSYTIEDNLKLKAELSGPFIKTPHEKWGLYQNLVAWISYCDRIGRKISKREEVFKILDKLWKDVRNSNLYKTKSKCDSCKARCIKVVK